MPRYLKKYDKETQDLINSIVLTPLQEEKLQKCMSSLHLYGNVRLRDVFPDMYKLYVVGTSTERIAKIYDRSIRTIQGIFKKFEIERTKEDIIRAEIHKVLTSDNYILLKSSGDFEELLMDVYRKYIK